MYSSAVPISLFADYISIPRVADGWNSRYRLCDRLWGRLWEADYSWYFQL